MDLNQIKDDINKDDDYKMQQAVQIRAVKSKSFQMEPQSVEEKVSGPRETWSLATLGGNWNGTCEV